MSIFVEKNKPLTREENLKWCRLILKVIENPDAYAVVVTDRDVIPGEVVYQKRGTNEIRGSNSQNV